MIVLKIFQDQYYAIGNRSGTTGERRRTRLASVRKCGAKCNYSYVVDPLITRGGKGIIVA